MENTQKSQNKLNYKKMLLIYNALNDGWSIKKINKSYIFTKKHEGKKEFFLDSYLASFISSLTKESKL